jgi:cell division protease FtsH
MTSQPPPKPFPVVYVVVPAVVLVLIGFLALWQFLTPTDRRVVVAYSDFIADVHSGKVDEIVIRNRDIRYRLRGVDNARGAIRETVGPVPDQALVESLKTTDPGAPQPKIIFEK